MSSGGRPGIQLKRKVRQRFRQAGFAVSCAQIRYSTFDDWSSSMIGVQSRAEEMMLRHGFLGVPTKTFAKAGHGQLMALIDEGLQPESKVLDIGCGCLRTGYWLIHFLDADGYHGIEPARQRVEYGLKYLFEDQDVKSKRPRFDFSSDFDSSAFGTRFDFFLAGSIWSHASKRQIGITLDSFLRDSTAGGVFLASYLPAHSRADDYQGDVWVGTSHESDTAGVIRHSLTSIEQQCRTRGLSVNQLQGQAFDGQVWLRVRRKP
jgi:hypothetical protein